MKFSVGRSPKCGLVINHACVSSRHASVRRDEDGIVRLRDEGSSNGTFINQPTHEIREVELGDDDLIFFSAECKVPSSLLLRKFLAWETSGGRARSALATGQAHRFTQEIITIGSDPGNLLVLPYVDVSPHHAAIVRVADGGGYVLQDLGAGCVAGGRSLINATAPLHSTDAIGIGGVSISTSFDPAGGAITIGAERRGFYLTTENVGLTIPTARGPRRLLDGVGFSIMPGEFVGVLGPSGSGKTTLLTSLGAVRPVAGVFYNGQALGVAWTNVVGYVPQDDVLFPELTVREMLYTSARLRLHGRISRARILAKIDEVCAMLGLVALCDTLIGSPEHPTLSGGEKKRVSLALELLTDPSILLLDEPTSGLSSADTRMVMECLRRLANEKGIPIIVTIHQPSPRVYKLLDHALYLKDGQVMWFGPSSPDSIHYFAPETGGGEGGGADEIMEALDDGETGPMRARYERSPYAHRFVEQRAGLIHALASAGELLTPEPIRPLQLPGQIYFLLRQQLTRRGRDLVSLAIHLGQAPLLGGLVGGVLRAERMNSPLFLLVFIAVWFGTNATARELVGERVVLRREQRGGVSPAAILLAKLADHGLMLALQIASLLLGAHLFIGFDLSLAQAWVILFFCGVCGAALGLVVSALARTAIAATTATPLVLIPLILFGGYLTPSDAMPVPFRAVSQVMPSRWGYEALVEAEKLRHRERDYELYDRDGTKIFLEFLSHQHGSAPADKRRGRIARALGVLALGTVGLTAAAWALLRRSR